MFSNNWFISKNGAKREIYSDDSVSHRTIYYNIPHPNARKKMETKLILSILSWAGVGSYVAGILLNMGTWKSDLMFFVGFLFMVMKLIRYTIKTWQDFRRGEIQIKKEKTEE